VLNRGRHLYSAGRPSRWASAHILVVHILDYESDSGWILLYINLVPVDNFLNVIT